MFKDRPLLSLTSLLRGAWLLLLSLTPVSTDAQPLLLNYRGFLEGLDSQASIRFSIHADSVSTKSLWTEQHDVLLQNGRFGVLLGSTSELGSELFRSTDEIYLSLQINGMELTPRQRLVSAPYAITSGHSRDVRDEDIHPRSIELAEGLAQWDSTGSLAAPVVVTDSLSIGTTPVIDSKGNWVGPASGGGMSLISVTTTDVTEDAIFFFNSKWVKLAQLDTFVDTPGGGKIEISLVAQLASGSAFETRLTMKQVSPSDVQFGQVGNIAGASGSSADQGHTLHNHAIVNVEDGRYRVFVEHKADAVVEATFLSAYLIIKHYR